MGQNVWIRGTWLGAGLGLVVLAGVASAQVPPPGAAPGAGAPPQPAGEQQPDGMRRGMHERGGEGARMGPRMDAMHRMMEMRRPPESKAAHFRLRKGDAVVDIKCADDEPTKACVDAAVALVGALPK